MSYTISMDKAGRIVIPKEVRERIGADEATKFDLDIVLGRIELTPEEKPEELPKVSKEGRMWVVSTGGKPFIAVESIQAIREERLERTTPDAGGAPQKNRGGGPPPPQPAAGRHSHKSHPQALPK